MLCGANWGYFWTKFCSDCGHIFPLHSNSFVTCMSVWFDSPLLIIASRFMTLNVLSWWLQCFWVTHQCSQWNTNKFLNLNFQHIAYLLFHDFINACIWTSLIGDQHWWPSITIGTVAAMVTNGYHNGKSRECHGHKPQLTHNTNKTEVHIQNKTNARPTLLEVRRSTMLDRTERLSQTESAVFELCRFILFRYLKITTAVIVPCCGR